MAQYDAKVEAYLGQLRQQVKDYMLKENTSCRKLAKDMKLSTPTLIKFLRDSGPSHPMSIFRIEDWLKTRKQDSPQKIFNDRVETLEALRTLMLNEEQE